MRYILHIFGFLACIYLLNSCANQRPPTGGAKDTIPPHVISTYPENYALNFRDHEIVITYDEFIKEDNLLNGLIITPRTDLDYEYKIKKRTLTLTFKEDLDSNTTYTFNFGDAIKDITEGNAVPNNTLAFSTGSYIDSLKVEGKIYNLLTNKAAENALVVLMKPDDSLKVWNTKPDYLTKTDSEGKYSIQNIKEGTYHIYAYEDKSKNLIMDINKETHGFMTEPFTLNGPIDSISFPITYNNLDTIRLMSARQMGVYYTIGFNKPIAKLKLSTTDKNPVPYLLEKGDKSIKIFNQHIKPDTISLELSVEDSAQFTIDTTLNVIFTETKRKPETFTMSINPRSGSIRKDSIMLTLTFSKPVKNILVDSMHIAYDTTAIDTITSKDISFNDTRNIITINKKLKEYEEYESGKSISFYISDSAVVSVEGDTLYHETNNNYTIVDDSEYGLIRGTIVTNYPSFIIQLLNKTYEIVAQKRDIKEYTFNYLPAGEYMIRVLIDEDENGIWEKGNILQGIAPEPVKVYPYIVNVRKNWEVTDVNIQIDN